MHGPPFQRPFTTSTAGFVSMWGCTDLHFRGLSQLGITLTITHGLHGPPFQRPFTTSGFGDSCRGLLHGPPFQRPFTTRASSVRRTCKLHGPPFQRPFTTRTPLCQAYYCCTDLHFRGLSQPFFVVVVGLLCCTDLHFRGLSQPNLRSLMEIGRCTDLHFRGLSQPPGTREHTPLRCTDLHFRGLSQQSEGTLTVIRVARTSISEAFHNSDIISALRISLHGPPFQRPFTTWQSVCRSIGSCTDLHFRGLSQHKKFHRKT